MQNNAEFYQAHFLCTTKILFTILSMILVINKNILDEKWGLILSLSKNKTKKSIFYGCLKSKR